MSSVNRPEFVVDRINAQYMGISNEEVNARIGPHVSLHGQIGS